MPGLPSPTHEAIDAATHSATAAAKSSSRTESVDDDEALAAYNAFLARINKPPDG